MFARLGSWCFRNRRKVLLMWVLGVAVVAAVASSVGGNFGQNFSPPGFESTRGLTTLKTQFKGTGAGTQGTIVFRADKGVEDPQVRATMEATFAMIERIAADPTVDVAKDPAFASLSAKQRTALAGADLALLKGMTVASPYHARRRAADRHVRARRRQGRLRLARAAQGPVRQHRATSAACSATCCRRPPGSRWRSAGGPSASSRSPSSETLGIAFAVVILVVAFGSVHGHGPADRRGAGRHRGRLRPRDDPLPPADHAGLRAVPRGDDRARGRHRLRAVHRHPVPREPPPRPHLGGGHGGGRRHGRAGPSPSRASPSSSPSSACS